MNMLLSLLMGVLFLAAGNCNVGQQDESRQQGIQGKVLLRTGNHMPGPDRKFPPASEPAIREMWVYALTNLSQVKTKDAFYTQIQTKLVAKVVSSPDGTFYIKLKPGKYSLFSKEQGGLFANMFDGEGNIFPVEVKAGQLTSVEFIIDYNASY